MALSLCSAATNCICRLVARRPAGVLLVPFVGDAFVGEADELSERRGSRRFISCHRANAVPRPKPDVARRAGEWRGGDDPSPIHVVRCSHIDQV